MLLKPQYFQKEHDDKRHFNPTETCMTSFITMKLKRRVCLKTY